MTHRILALGGLAVVALLTALCVGGMSVILGTLALSTVAFGMLLDERTEFADATVIPTPTGRGLVGDVYDLQVARNIGNARTLYLVIQITEAVTSAGAATVEFELVSDAQAAIAVDGTATIHWRSGAIAKATLIVGFTMVIPLPGVKPDYERFVGVITNPAVAALTAGKMNAFFTFTPKQWKALADGTSGI